MISINGSWCCGLKEVSGLRHYNRQSLLALDSIYTAMRNHGQGQVPFLVFTEAAPGLRTKVVSLYGRQLMNSIKRSKLGTVTVAGPSRNPNSMNYVRVYTWKVDWTAYNKWAAKRGNR